jgi:ABC-2 type transport system ATP-binding protein
VAVIEVQGLRKEYRRVRGPSTVAVDGLDMAVPEGGVFGFLGPNGSGKTTTIRCLLALVRPSRGTCRVLGADSASDLHRVIAKVGTIVEAPTFFPQFSGRRNLLLLGRLYGIDRRRVDEVLEQVGLADRAGDRVKSYSLGMRQRLGIGAALLKDPTLLILDEPANGLDPAGIKEVRELLRRLGDEGRTVFLSSHLLGEVQHICDRVAILSRGRCIAAGPVDEVLTQGREAGLIVRLDEPTRGLEALAASGIESSLDGGVLRVRLPATEGARVTKALADRGLYLRELRAEEISLESVFLELTGEPAVPPGPPGPAEDAGRSAAPPRDADGPPPPRPDAVGAAP